MSQDKDWYGWPECSKPEEKSPTKLSGFIAKNGDVLEISKHIDEKEPRYNINGKETDKETYDKMFELTLAGALPGGRKVVPPPASNPCKFSSVQDNLVFNTHPVSIATAEIASVTPQGNAHHRGDLKIDGDLIVEGHLDVSGSIKAGEQEPEVLLTPEELKVIGICLDSVPSDALQSVMEISGGEVEDLLGRIYNKLIDEEP